MMMMMMMMMMLMMMKRCVECSRNGEEDSEENDYCNYSLPAVAMHDDIYQRLVDVRLSLSPKVHLFLCYIHILSSILIILIK